VHIKKLFYDHIQITIYLLTPWSRVLQEKLIVFHLVKKFPGFYGTRRFITAFTNARQITIDKLIVIISRV